MNKSSACSKQEARRDEAVNAWRMSTHVVIWEKQAVRSGCVCRVRGYVCTSELGRCVRVLDFTNCMKKSGCVYMCGDDTQRMRGKLGRTTLHLFELLGRTTHVSEQGAGKW